MRPSECRFREFSRECLGRGRFPRTTITVRELSAPVRKKSKSYGRTD
jgi:hypothetical protein